MNRSTEISKNGLSLVLLIIYLSVLFLNPFHDLIHESAAEEICYDENPCHLRLVHHDQKNGCDHKFHLSAEGISCDFCALVKIKPTTSADRWTPIIFPDNRTSWSISYNSELYDSFTTGIFDRGPPFNS